MSNVEDRFLEKLFEYAVKHKVEVEIWKGTQSAKVYTVAPHSSSPLLYFKVSTSEEPFWGLNASVIEQMNKSGLTWHVLLLESGAESVYHLPSHAINRMIKEKKIKLTRGPQYIVRKNRLRLEKELDVEGFAELLVRIWGNS